MSVRVKLYFTKDEYEAIAAAAQPPATREGEPPPQQSPAPDVENHIRAKLGLKKWGDPEAPAAKPGLTPTPVPVKK